MELHRVILMVAFLTLVSQVITSAGESINIACYIQAVQSVAAANSRKN